MADKQIFYFSLILLGGILIVDFSVFSFVFYSKPKSNITHEDVNPDLHKATKNLEVGSTLLSTGTDFGGEMTYQILDNKVTEMVVSTGVSDREVIIIFTYPENDSWTYTYVERYFARDEDYHADTSLTSHLDIGRYFFLGDKLVKSVCISGNKQKYDPKFILTERRFYLKIAKLKRVEVDIEAFIRDGVEAFE